MNRLVIQHEIVGTICDYLNTCRNIADEVGTEISRRVAKALLQSGCNVFDTSTVCENIRDGELEKIIRSLETEYAAIAASIVFRDQDIVFDDERALRKLSIPNSHRFLEGTRDTGILCIVGTGIVDVITIVREMLK